MQWTLAVGLLALMPSAVTAQPRPIELTKPEARLDESFSQLAAVRELRDGRVLLVDTKEKLLQIGDFARKTVQTIGHQGSGPGEYNTPIGLVAMPGDLTWVYDPLNQRFLVVSPDGKPGELVPLSSLGSLKGLSMMLLPSADARGRLYFEAVNQTTMSGKDSTVILRWTRGQAALDTAGYVAPMDFGIETVGGKMRIRAMRMFAPQETWVVDPAGRLARVTPAPYRVIWYDAARKATIGPAVRYQPVPVTEDEKDEVRKQIKQALAGVGAAAAVRQGFKVPEPEFAPTKPPFAGKGTALIGPAGEVWVARSGLLKEPTRYDRFDPQGRLVGQVSLNPRSIVLGFGRGTLYVARKDEDDLMYLERYRWPAR